MGNLKDLFKAGMILTEESLALLIDRVENTTVKDFEVYNYHTEDEISQEYRSSFHLIVVTEKEETEQSMLQKFELNIYQGVNTEPINIQFHSYSEGWTYAKPRKINNKMWMLDVHYLDLKTLPDFHTIELIGLESDKKVYLPIYPKQDFKIDITFDKKESSLIPYSGQMKLVGFMSMYKNFTLEKIQECLDFYIYNRDEGYRPVEKNNIVFSEDIPGWSWKFEITTPYSHSSYLLVKEQDYLSKWMPSAKILAKVDLRGVLDFSEEGGGGDFESGSGSLVNEPNLMYAYEKGKNIFNFMIEGQLSKRTYEPGDYIINYTEDELESLFERPNLNSSSIAVLTNYNSNYTIDTVEYVALGIDSEGIYIHTEINPITTREINNISFTGMFMYNNELT